MQTGYLRRAFSILILVPTALSAQMAREHDPTRLTNWPAPLYWQPGVAPETTATPQVATTSLPQGSAALVFVAMTPCRIMDTRAGMGFTGAFGPPSIGAGLPVRTIPVLSNPTCSIPSVAQAYSFNVTLAPPGGVLYLTLYPATSGSQPSPPNASTVNDPLGTVVANAAIVPAGTDGNGSVDAYASSATDLIIDINGYYAPPDFNGNLALGDGALANNTGLGNTAMGDSALAANTTGYLNTATGAQALELNVNGANNTAVGYLALMENTSGSANTAIGVSAMQNNGIGSDSTAVGYQALMMGGGGTAIGWQALQYDTTGIDNTATGRLALNQNNAGSYNTADGNNALAANTAGGSNAAIGNNALQDNITGGGNTAVGADAMFDNTTGNNNIAIGTFAGWANSAGNNNIEIGNGAGGAVSNVNSNNIHIGSVGIATDSGVIRIGTSPGAGVTSAQTSFFAAGIRGVTTGNNDAIPVVIDSNGQLGTVSSSARFKEDIHDMGNASSGLLRLRPVTFRYRQPFADGSKPVQFGLIADEVEKVYPDLVAHSADGQIESVKYQVLDSMLLNEVQKQAEKIRSLEERLAALEAMLPKSPLADHQ